MRYMLAVGDRNQCNAYGEDPNSLYLELLDRQENQSHGEILRDDMCENTIFNRNKESGEFTL